MSARMRPFLAVSSLLLLLAGGVLPARAAQATTASFESPTYGYEVSWDADIWSSDDSARKVDFGPAAIDEVRLVHAEGGTLHVIAGRFGYPDAAACVGEESNILASEDGVSGYGPLPDGNGGEMAGTAGEIAFGGFELLYTPSMGEPLNLVNFIECRLLPETDAALIFVLITTPDQFERHMTEAAKVNASLQLAQAGGVATPAAEPPAEPVEVTVDEEWFAAQVAVATAGGSVAGPDSGELVQAIGATAQAVTGADTANFYLRARFQNPDGAADAPWDFGVSFREQPSGEHYRVVIDSNGDWYLSLGVETDVQIGSVTSLQSAPGASNSLEVVAAGDVGAFRLNGELVGPLDLSALDDSGQIAIGTAFFASNTSEGAVIRYRDLEVWPLAGGDVAEPAETPETVPTAEPAPTAATETPEPGLAPTAEPTAIPAVEPLPTAAPIEPAPTEPAAVPAATVSADQVVIRLRPINQSGVEGLAILYPDGDRTTVALTMLGASEEEVGAIHAGTCAAFEPLPEYALATFDRAGRASSTINVPLAELRSAGLVVLLHQSTAEFGNVVACGEIPTT